MIENISDGVSGKFSKLAPLQPGSRTDSAGKPISNVILLSLPDKEFNLLRPHLEPLDLFQHKILMNPARKSTSLIFLMMEWSRWSPSAAMAEVWK
jgi:hypothetical protein